MITAIARTNADDNNSSECLQKDESRFNFDKKDESWIKWKLAKDVWIKKDYLEDEPPKKDGYIPLLAGDWDTSVIEIDEKKKTVEMLLIHFLFNRL